MISAVRVHIPHSSIDFVILLWFSLMIFVFFSAPITPIFSIDTAVFGFSSSQQWIITHRKPPIWIRAPHMKLSIRTMFYTCIPQKMPVHRLFQLSSMVQVKEERSTLRSVREKQNRFHQWKTSKTWCWFPWICVMGTLRWYGNLLAIELSV